MPFGIAGGLRRFSLGTHTRYCFWTAVNIPKKIITLINTMLSSMLSVYYHKLGFLLGCLRSKSLFIGG